MTNTEFRDAVIAAYREKTGVEPPSVRVTGDEQTGFTVTFSTAVWSRDAAKAVAEFRSAAMVHAISERANVEASKALGQQPTAETLRAQLLAANAELTSAQLEGAIQSDPSGGGKA